jgi:hypothetical protein
MHLKDGEVGPLANNNLNLNRLYQCQSSDIRGADLIGFQNGIN